MKIRVNMGKNRNNCRVRIPYAPANKETAWLSEKVVFLSTTRFFRYQVLIVFYHVFGENTAILEQNMTKNMTNQNHHTRVLVKPSPSGSPLRPLTGQIIAARWHKKKRTAPEGTAPKLKKGNIYEKEITLLRSPYQNRRSAAAAHVRQRSPCY